MSTLEERLNAPPAVKWDPYRNSDDPESILGVIEDRYTYHSQKYSDSETLVVRDNENNGWLVYCSYAVLRSKMEENDYRTGGQIGIKFVGERKSGTDGAYPDFHVVYEPPAGGPMPTEGGAPAVVVVDHLTKPPDDTEKSEPSETDDIHF